ncbi:MAG: sialidase family protein [Actinomycetota bacterium]
MRRLIAAVAASTALLALCVSGAQAAPSFGTPVKMPNGTGTEPGVHVAGDGTVYVDAPQGVGFHSKLWRSNSHGGYDALDFQTPIGRFPGGGDSETLLGRGLSKRVYFLDLWAGSNSLSRSEDGGSTWTAGTPFTTLPLSDRQWMALGPTDSSGNDTVYIVYALIQPPKAVMFARSTDSGQTFTFHTPAAPLETAQGFTSHVVADAHGFVAFAWKDSSTNTLHASYSTDSGTTWKSSSIASNVYTATIPAFAIDPTNSNHLYAAWIDKDSFAVKEASSIDGGVTWGPATTLSDPGTSNMFVWLTSNGSKVAAAWYGTSAATGDPNTFAATVPWNVMYSEDTGSGFSTTVVSSAGNPKHGPICTQGVLCTSGRELGDFLTLAIDNNGKAIIAYVDTTNAEVKVVSEL